MRPSYEQLLDWIKPGPATDDETACMELLEPGDLEVYGSKIDEIIAEAKEIFMRIGVSAMLRTGDLVVAICTASGDMVAASTGTYAQAVISQLPVKFTVQNWLDNPTVGAKPGDIFYFNEPLYGSMHGPDQTAFMPVFNDGELVAWVLACVHQSETGATEPGGMVLRAANRFYEGVKITPIKFGENYQLRDDLVEMLFNYMARSPRVQMNDIRARAAACQRLELRVSELAKEKGNPFIKGLFRSVITESEKAVRARTRSWNDGTYRALAFQDHVGSEEGLLRCFVEMRKKGDRIEFDFTGTSPEHDAGADLAMPHHVVATGAQFLFSHVFHDLPVSSGAFAPLDWVLPAGTMFSAGPMAPVSRAPSLLALVVAALYELFAKMAFDSEHRELILGGSGGGSSMNIVGLNQEGIAVSDILSYPFNTEGQGARTDMDGTDSNSFVYAPASRGYDAEDSESQLPLLTLFQNHRRDSCGFGKFRGGSGVVSAYVVHGTPEISFSSGGRESRMRMCQGIFGGYPSGVKIGIEVENSRLFEQMRDGEADLPSDIHQLVTERTIDGTYKFSHNRRPLHRVREGDVVIHLNGGGSGYGDVLERDPEALAEDMRRGIVSPEVAQDVFCIVFDGATFEVDLEKTAEKRDEERKDRLRRGRSYDEFEAEWLEKRPTAQALKHYGSWPDAEKVRDIVRR
ncbi:MAG: hydantoinase B/oxoprolinase family protein [Thermoleophilia bacterium]|nr:hydantoinase B/oxoprolinase family protein [Thermoleophilia bacterium]